ncbi:MAG: hypothetical protein PHD00_05720 [Bacteroidales bacterium]|nr:hypothetical protein [Bacteroidales bacterium]
MNFFRVWRANYAAGAIYHRDIIAVRRVVNVDSNITYQVIKGVGIAAVVLQNDDIFFLFATG